MTGAAPRWAISFADLGLLLLGCFVLLHAMESAKPKVAGSAAIGEPTSGYLAADLFERGEARLTERGRALLAGLGRASAGRNVSIVSTGIGEGGSRLDRFELAAARSAAVARTLQENGVGEGSLSLSVHQGGAGPGQRIEIVRR